MAALLDEVGFTFQPVINMRIGSPIAVEGLVCGSARPVGDLYRHAKEEGRLGELDGALAAAAVTVAAERHLTLPLHINLLASTVVHDVGVLHTLRERVHAVGRGEHEITLEIARDVGELEPDLLLVGIEELRRWGFGIALHEVGDSEVALTLVANARPDLVKLSASVVRGLEEQHGHLAVLESVHTLCEATGALLVATGVDTHHQLTTIQQHDIRLAQGNLLAPPAPRPSDTVHLPHVSPTATGQATRDRDKAAGPRVTEFLSPATMLPTDATGERVRQVLAEHPDISGVVLVDDGNRPQHTLDRNRFLLAITGAYGHALYAKKPASRLADNPRLVTTSTTATEALELITSSHHERIYDDAVVVDQDGRCLAVVRASHLIRGLAQLQVEEAVALNPLTRLPGSDSIDREVTRCLDTGTAFAVGWLDIDRFKDINDTAGFCAGDDVIRSIGRSLTDAATSLTSVQVAHLGGDDFLLVAHPDELATLAKKLLSLDRETHGMPYTLSLATLVCPPGTVASHSEASHLLAPIKQAAKRLHGNSWTSAHAETNTITVQRGHDTAPETTRPPSPSTDGGHADTVDEQPRRDPNVSLLPRSSGDPEQDLLQGQLREALHDDGLSLHYQPIVTADGTTIACEALVRWPHPQRGLLGPNEFLPAAALGHLLRELDRWVLRTAVHEATTWPAQIAVTVNLAGLLPGDPTFVEEITELLAATGLPGSRLILELVETSLIHLPLQSRHAMRALAEHGVRFAMDDFGSGHSSLARLQDLPVQILKLDRCFVSNIDIDPNSLAITQAILDMVRAMGQTCIAEGVETTSQLTVLRGLGLDGYQGWLFSRPMPPGDLHPILNAQR